MDINHPFGLYLFHKERKDLHVLKELLQFLKTNCRGRAASFAYVEAQTSLIPNLSLWENLQMVVGCHNWMEFMQALSPQWQPLARLLRDTDRLASSAEVWEKFCISLLKGLHGPGNNLLVDMNEDLLSPLMVQNFKKTLISTAKDRHIYLATANTSLWLDCAHTLVTRKDYEFVSETLDHEKVKLHWVA